MLSGFFSKRRQEADLATSFAIKDLADFAADQFEFGGLRLEYDGL